ncbi:MAG: DUF1289 domain-containing protein [Kordiimonadaceae bacterium]|nr:DUF1289 domain-containing protein [Kordiimonadaceae bacterium]
MVLIEEEISSPCIQQCQLHAASQICTGCLRTRDEIAFWSQADNIFKKKVLAELPSRRTAGNRLFIARA